MKQWKAVLLSFVALLCLGASGLYVYMQGLGDVRTEFAKKEGTSATSREKGRVLLARSISKLGGVERWEQLRQELVKVSFQHDWHHDFLRTFFMPLEFSGQKLSLLVRPGRLDARLTFLDGEWKGRVWGTSQGRTYRVDSDGAVSWERDETIEFNVSGYRFFFFMPFLLSEAELVTYAGDATLHGKTYDLVYATWGQWEPQRTVDQYLMWIDRETSMVNFVQSTVREKFARSIVSLSLSDYRDVLGVRLPFSLKVLEDMSVLDVGMHHMKVLSIDRAPDDASKLLFEDQERG